MMSVPPKNLAVFTRQLSVMIDAGLPLVQCLEILGRQETHAGFAATIRTVRRDVEAGAALATAMKKHPGVFDTLYSSLIAAGEAGGILDTILKRLAVYIEQNVKLRRDVRSALVYPVAVLVVAIVVVAAILWKVIPTFADLFEGLGAELPWATRVVIGASDGIVAYGWLIAAAAVIGVSFVKRYYDSPEGRHAVDRVAAGGTGPRRGAAQGSRRAVLPHVVDADYVRCSDPSGAGDNRADRRECGDRARDTDHTLRDRARGADCSPLACHRGFSSDGRPDDQCGRNHGGARRHALQDRGFLRRGGRSRRRGPAGAAGTGAGDLSRGCRRRVGHRDVSADLRFDQPGGLTAVT